MGFIDGATLSILFLRDINEQPLLRCSEEEARPMSYQPGTAADFSEASEEPRQTFGASGAGVEVLHQVCLFCVFFGCETNWSEYRLCPASTPASDASTNAHGFDRTCHSSGMGIMFSPDACHAIRMRRMVEELGQTQQRGREEKGRRQTSLAD